MRKQKVCQLYLEDVIHFYVKAILPFMMGLRTFVNVVHSFRNSEFRFMTHWMPFYSLLVFLRILCWHGWPLKFQGYIENFMTVIYFLYLSINVHYIFMPVILNFKFKPVQSVNFLYYMQILQIHLPVNMTITVKYFYIFII